MSGHEVSHTRVYPEGGHKGYYGKCGCGWKGVRVSTVHQAEAAWNDHLRAWAEIHGQALLGIGGSKRVVMTRKRPLPEKRLVDGIRLCRACDARYGETEYGTAAIEHESTCPILRQAIRDWLAAEARVSATNEGSDNMSNSNMSKSGMSRSGITFKAGAQAEVIAFMQARPNKAYHVSDVAKALKYDNVQRATNALYNALNNPSNVATNDHLERFGRGVYRWVTVNHEPQQQAPVIPAAPVVTPEQVTAVIEAQVKAKPEPKSFASQVGLLYEVINVLGDGTLVLMDEARTHVLYGRKP